MQLRSSGGHRVGIGLARRPWRDPEEAELRIDRVQASVGPRLDPGDVVAYGGDLPAFQSRRRNQHREVGLPAGARKGGSHIGLLPGGRFHPQDQHVLGEPALIPAHGGGDAQREALLAQQGIAAVTAAERPDRALFGEMHDVLVLAVARPRHIALARCKRHSHGMQARYERAVLTEGIDGGSAHAGHDAHAYRDVSRVGDFHTDMRDGRADRAHGKRHHVHSPPAHAALEQLAQPCLHLARLHPVVGGAGVGLVDAADERAVLDARNVRRIGTRQEAARVLVGGERQQGAVADQLGAQAPVLLLGALAPDDALRAGQVGDLHHPLAQALVPDVVGNLRTGRSGGIEACGSVHGYALLAGHHSFNNWDVSTRFIRLGASATIMHPPER